MTNIVNPADFIVEGNANITPDQARFIASSLGYDGNRKLSPSHVQKLAEYMRRGKWLEKSTIDFARFPDGRLVLLNGHHRMAAQASTGFVGVLWNFVFHDVEGEDDLQGLYYRFDTEVRKRSANNIVGGVKMGETLGLGGGAATALWRSSTLIASGMTFRHYAKTVAGPLMDERMAVCEEYAEPARQMEFFVSLAPPMLRRKLLTVSMFGLAVVTLKYQPLKAAEFWKGLCEDDGLAKGDPRKALLQDMHSRHGVGKLLAAQLMAGARAWDSFFHGKDQKIIRVTGSDIRIAGTPFTVSTQQGE